MRTILRISAVLLAFLPSTACQPPDHGPEGSASRSDSVRTDLGNMRFVAHMGLSSQAPANTLPAFELAGKSGGFIGIETDVRETKDGAFVLYHDDDLASRTTGSGTVSSQTLAQIQTYVIRKGNNLSQYTDLRVPRVEDYLAICKRYGVKPVLHIKQITNEGIKKLLATLVDNGLMNEAIVTGGKADMTRFRAESREVVLFWMNLIGNAGTDWAAANNMQINTDYSEVTADKVAYAHSKGLKVGAWTVNDAETIKNLARAGIDFVTTDNFYGVIRPGSPED